MFKYNMHVSFSCHASPDLQHEFDMSSDQLASDYVANLVKNYFSTVPYFQRIILYTVIHDPLLHTDEFKHVASYYPTHGCEVKAV